MPFPALIIEEYLITLELHSAYLDHETRDWDDHLVLLASFLPDADEWNRTTIKDGDGDEVYFFEYKTTCSTTKRNHIIYLERLRDEMNYPYMMYVQSHWI